MRGARRRVPQCLHEAYQTIKVDPDKYLEHLRMAYDLPALTYEGVYSVNVEVLDQHRRRRPSAAACRFAAAEGAGLGMGGMFTILPDLGILAAITIRMIQKLSLIYGFPYNTEQEEAELWVAAASAAGVDISRELVEKQVVSKFVPRVIQRIAAQSQRGVRREVDGAAHTVCQLGDWRWSELLLHARLGRARCESFSPAALSCESAIRPFIRLLCFPRRDVRDTRETAKSA